MGEPLPVEEKKLEPASSDVSSTQGDIDVLSVVPAVSAAPAPQQQPKQQPKKRGSFFCCGHASADEEQPVPNEARPLVKA